MCVRVCVRVCVCVCVCVCPGAGVGDVMKLDGTPEQGAVESNFSTALKRFG